MPSWTLGDLMSQVTTRAGRRSDLAASDVSLWVNQAMQDFVREVPQLSNETWQIFSLNSGDSRVALPANYLETISISNHTTDDLGTFPQLRQVSVEWADAQGYYPVSDPEAYFLFESGIHIWPAANSSALTTVWSGRSYMHRYRAIPPDMVSTGSTPSVMTECRIGILYLAEAYIHELVGNYAEAAEARVRYVSYAASVKDAFAKRQSARGGRYAIQLADRSGRRRSLEPNLEDQDEWLRR